MEKPLPSDRKRSVEATTTKSPLSGSEQVSFRRRRVSSTDRRESATECSRSRVSFDIGRNRPADKSKFAAKEEKTKISEQNTFQLEPECLFPVDRATAIIKDILHKALDGVDYDVDTCSRLCKSLADQLKSEMRQFHLPRYKLVSSCCIGDRNCQGLRIASRCAWDEIRDNYASYAYENKTLFATATVYGVYFS
jgi:hypothetical protein